MDFPCLSPSSEKNSPSRVELVKIVLLLDSKRPDDGPIEDFLNGSPANQQVYNYVNTAICKSMAQLQKTQIRHEYRYNKLLRRKFEKRFGYSQDAFVKKLSYKFNNHTTFTNGGN